MKIQNFGQDQQGTPKKVKGVKVVNDIGIDTTDKFCSSGCGSYVPPKPPAGGCGGYVPPKPPKPPKPSHGGCGSYKPPKPYTGC